MQKVIILEYIGQESIPFDLYNSFREVVYQKDTPLTQNMILQFASTNVYKADSEEPLESEISKIKYNIFSMQRLLNLSVI